MPDATIRQIARVDSALAHLLGFTCLQVVSVNVWGDPEQRARYLGGTVEGRWWWGNAVNPLDTRLVASATGDGGYRLDGQKGFCSGTRGSHMMTVSGHDPVTGKAVFAGGVGVTVPPTGAVRIETGTLPRLLATEKISLSVEPPSVDKTV